MAEYIDRQEVIETVAFYREDADSIDHALNSIKSIPSADVAPVVHGKWEEVHEWMGDVEYSCSVCGCYALWKELTTDQVCTEYCPRCGAKMDGDDNG